MKLGCIALFSPVWPPGSMPNGIVTTVGILRPALEAAGVRTIILSGRPVSEDAGADVIALTDEDCFWRQDALPYRMGIRVSKGRIIQKRFLEILTKKIEKAGSCDCIDLVELPDTFGHALGVSRRLQIPTVVRLHGPWFLNETAKEQKFFLDFNTRVRMEGEGMRSADGVTSPSEAVLDRCRQRYGKLAPLTQVIPNPCEPVLPEEQWRPDRCDPDEVLFVGRFDRLKGADTLLAGIEKARKEHPKLHLTFAGPDSGIGEQPRLCFEEYCRMRHPTLLDKGVVDFLGAVPHKDLGILRRRAFATLVCSRWESFSYTAAEAMSYGCPLLATRAGGIAEIVKDGETGLLFDVDDSDGLARNLGALLSDRNRAAKMAVCAAEHMSKRYHPKQIAGEMIAFYERVLAAHPRRRSR